jgi:hypothetical protein
MLGVVGIVKCGGREMERGGRAEGLYRVVWADSYACITLSPLSRVWCLL